MKNGVLVLLGSKNQVCRRGAGGFYKFFKKYFVALETIVLNIFWPNSFFGKCFITSPINFSFLFKAYL